MLQRCPDLNPPVMSRCFKGFYFGHRTWIAIRHVFYQAQSSWLRRPKSAGALGPTAQKPERFLRRPGRANWSWMAEHGGALGMVSRCLKSFLWLCPWMVEHQTCLEMNNFCGSICTPFFRPGRSAKTHVDGWSEDDDPRLCVLVIPGFCLEARCVSFLLR